MLFLVLFSEVNKKARKGGTAFASIVNRAGLLCSADNLYVMSTTDQKQTKMI